MKSFGVLLGNIGSPASPSLKDVGRYLGEFLMDPKVIDLPWMFRWPLVKLIIKSRLHTSKAAYKKIWTKDGSPLIAITQSVVEKLQKRMQLPVALGMRYSKPTITQGIEALTKQGVNHIVFLPQYPHYAMSSFESSEIHFHREIQKREGISYSIWQPIYGDHDYIDVLAKSITPYFDQENDHLLFSYHGLPRHHLPKTKGGNLHCLKDKKCCEIKHDCQAFCYRYQIYRTSVLVAEKMGLGRDKYDVSFQSRLSKNWLQPFTDVLVPQLLAAGTKNLVVVCPSFLADCLETLEEVGLGLKEEFISRGGESFKQVPCLNDGEDWLRVLEGKIRKMMTNR